MDLLSSLSVECRDIADNRIVPMQDLSLVLIRFTDENICSIVTQVCEVVSRLCNSLYILGNASFCVRS